MAKVGRAGGEFVLAVVLVWATGCVSAEPNLSVDEGSARIACPDDDNPCTRAAKQRGKCTQRPLADGTACGMNSICLAAACVVVATDAGADSGTGPADGGTDAGADAAADAGADAAADAGAEAAIDAAPDAVADAAIDACVPSAETCNGRDDDCDGLVDNGLAPGAACDGPDGDQCREGVFSCVGGTLICSDNTNINLEACNGIDDDCDGAIDEGLDCTTLPAGVRVISSVTLLSANKVKLWFSGDTTDNRPDGWSAYSVWIRRPGFSITNLCAAWRVLDSQIFHGLHPETDYEAYMVYDNGVQSPSTFFRTPALTDESVAPTVFGARLPETVGWWAPHGEVFVEHRDDTGVDHTDAYVDGAFVGADSIDEGVVTYRWNGVDDTGFNRVALPAPLTPGDHVVRAVVFDTLGNSAAREFSVNIPSLCGNGVCDARSEDCAICPGDCGSCSGAHCGDATCDGNGGELCTTCASDCNTRLQSVCGNGECSPVETSASCYADCGPATWPADWVAFEQRALVLINEQRALGTDCPDTGAIPPSAALGMEAPLRRAAQLTAWDNAYSNYLNWDHTSCNGRSFSIRALAQGTTTSGEVAGSDTTPEAMVRSWMMSGGHCRIIMNPFITVVGIGYSTVDGEYRWAAMVR